MIRLRNTVQGFLMLALLAFTWAVNAYHLSVFTPPPDTLLHASPDATAKRFAHWIDKSQLGIHQLVLTGAPVERGVAAGAVTRGLLFREENEMIGQLDRFFPAWLRRPLEVVAFRWFWGIDRYLEPWMTQEMWGVAQSASKKFEYLGDNFTRQVQYHAVHEVGQMMVDQTGDDMGCTVIAIPSVDRQWVIGRTFDFEGGRIFDSEKIMKWVFPDQGHAFVSVIWAGMVGAVTAVNDQGLYLSLNAAGSTDFRRYGTPSTLVLLKALQFASTADEAVSIIRAETMFITDIFVVADRAGVAYRIEKSPDNTEVIRLDRPTVVTNHLVSERWQNDKINVFRRDELTSMPRLKRGEELVQKLVREQPKDLPAAVLSILRDKGADANGNRLHLGNRRGIDALIAAHAAVYDSRAGQLFVSRGPGVSGELIGFDLAKSFATHQPTLSRRLARDPLVDDHTFDAVHASARFSAEAEKLIKKKKCADAKDRLDKAGANYDKAYWYFAALGDYASRCLGNQNEARTAWQKAANLTPAYPREARALAAKLKVGK